MSGAPLQAGDNHEHTQYSQQVCELRCSCYPVGETEVETNQITLPPKNLLINTVEIYEKGESYFFD